MAVTEKPKEAVTEKPIEAVTEKPIDAAMENLLIQFELALMERY